MIPRPGFIVPSRFALACALALPLLGADPKPAPANEIIVSAANYATTPPKELARILRRDADITDPAPLPAVPASGTPQYYVFNEGESFTSDLNYQQVCRLLLPALAGKNYVNASNPGVIKLVLRVSWGERRWRDPMVRADNLEWRHGLTSRRKDTAVGADVVWDPRAGGDEDTLREIERQVGADFADHLIGSKPVEDYFLIVVDAFDYAELKARKNQAPRVWTTFIAVPARKDQKLSDVATAMINKAAPYFGETAPGRIRFIDREGTVSVGEATVVDDAKPAPPKPK
jgi:hypothetical protein